MCVCVFSVIKSQSNLRPGWNDCKEEKSKNIFFLFTWLPLMTKARETADGEEDEEDE